MPVEVDKSTEGPPKKDVRDDTFERSAEPSEGVKPHQQPEQEYADEGPQEGDPAGYRESEDEDFQLEEEQDDDGDEQGDSDVAYSDAEDEGAPKGGYAQLQGSGGLIKTRAARRAEALAEKTAAPKHVGTHSVDVDALWAEMNSTGATPSSSSTQTPSHPQEEYVDIDRTFKFAGKVTSERKRVLKSSAEGQAWLRQQASLKPAEAVNADDSKDSETASPSTEINSENEPISAKDHDASAPHHAVKKGILPGGRRPVKRKMSLMEEYQAGKTKKISTLEKSRLDWLGFVDNEGIKDDLKKHNKAGYLDKQGFLARVEEHVDKDVRAHRKHT